MSFDELNKSDLGYNGLPSYMEGFEAGAQSRQAEVDELRKRVKELELINFDSELHFDAAKEQIDELQKRIDAIKSKVQDLWTALDDRQSKEFIIDSCELIIGEILKGDQS